MSRQSEDRHAAQEKLTLARLIAQDPFRARSPSAPGSRTPLGVRPGMRGLKTGDVDGLSPYMPGGDVRMIDWRGFARSGQLRLKEREREAHSAIMLVADLGSHMRFGTSDGTLAFRAALAVARHAWTALRRDEPVGIAVTGQGALVQPARGRRRLMHALDMLAQTFNHPWEGGATLESAIEQSTCQLRSADELWVFSDFHHWNNSESLPRAEHGRSGRWYAVQIDDPIHSACPPSGAYPARSMIDGQVDEDLYLQTSAAEHATAVVEAAAGLNRALEAQGWRIAGDAPARSEAASNVA